MRNRAKCKLCGDIIESFHASDYVSCKCGEISVDGGAALWCSCNSWDNFIRIDDDGKEIAIKLEKSPIPIPEEVTLSTSRKEVIEMIDEMIKTYEGLPQNAMTSPVTHYDLLSVLLLVSALFKASD